MHGTYNVKMDRYIAVSLVCYVR
jgi:hypothetical protein